MTQAQLDRAVARATGESVDFIRKFGFSALTLPPRPQPIAQEAQLRADTARNSRQVLHAAVVQDSREAA